jgi:type I restriction enzyme S subunit
MDNERTAEPLDAVADMLSGGTPSKSNPRYWNGSIPWLTPKDMGRWSGATEAKVSPEAIGNGTRLAPKDAIFVAVRGMSLHNEIRVVRAHQALTFNQDIKAIVARKGIDPLYLYYVLVSKKPQLLDTVEAAGHGTGRLPTDKLKDLLIPRFDPLTEASLAELFGALDRRIELNRRMNETLAAMARAIFKDWFVDFGPTRAKAEGRAPYLAPEIWGLFPMHSMMRTSQLGGHSDPSMSSRRWSMALRLPQSNSTLTVGACR